MRHKKHIGSARFLSPNETNSVPAHTRGRHHGHGRGRRGGQPLDYGDLRLLMLTMIAAEPSHGYRLIKAIEEKFGGTYTPSPGVIYPTLAWLNDIGYATAEAAEGGRKLYRITPEGETFLAANRTTIDDLVARSSSALVESRKSASPQIGAAMDALKTALRLRLKDGPVDEATTERIATAINEAAKAIARD